LFHRLQFAHRVGSSYCLAAHYTCGEEVVTIAVVETYGADASAKDPARTLRLPGTWNLKPGRPAHLVKIISATGARHTRDSLLDAFPPPARRPRVDPTGPRPNFNGHAPPGLERFHEALKWISPDGYATWLDVGMALHHESGGSDEGLLLWIQWSAGCDKWCDGECEDKWRSFCAGGGKTGGTIFALAGEQGYVRSARRARSKGAAGGTPPPRGDHTPPHHNEDPPKTSRPLVRIQAGRHSEIATEAETHLLAAGAQFYQRGSKLVRPIIARVAASDKRKTTTAALADVDEVYMRDMLGRISDWERYVRREKQWIPADPSLEISRTILKRAGEWRFPAISGIITTPTLRPDGTILGVAGYDAATGLLLLDPPRLPQLPERPSREHARAALTAMEDLLIEFPFVDKASRSVALSAMITPVVRGAFAVAPLHVARAPTAGTGKSLLFDICAAIAVGNRCHVIAAGRNEEETEKRLAACLLAGYPLVSIDNVNGELGGDFLCQVIERPLISPRILGRSEQPLLQNQMTVYANGNNIRMVGDMTRRSLISSLDAKVERPELRTFRNNPVDLVFADRGRYVAAALTVVRAYIVAGSPGLLQPKFASFEGWSDMVRSALVWLGCVDPVATTTVARAEDPVLQGLRALVSAWVGCIGAGPTGASTAAQLLEKAEEKQPPQHDDDVRYRVRTTDGWRYPALREALEALGYTGNRGSEAKSFGRWLSNHQDRIVDGHALSRLEQKGDQSHRYYVQKISESV
jgi:Primase C terminal 2 (PriCT-2)